MVLDDIEDRFVAKKESLVIRQMIDKAVQNLPSIILTQSFR